MKNYHITYLLLIVGLLACETKTKESMSSVDQQLYMEKGQSYVADAQALLGSNLMKAMHTSGTLGALGFCNANGITLTDSAAKTLNVTIKRVSDLNRNPNNMANQDELSYIKSQKELISKGKTAEPLIHQSNDMITGYYPIMTNQVCLKCHGTETTMDRGTIAMLKKFYPNDKALGYEINQLRGIWVIEMEKDLK